MHPYKKIKAELHSRCLAFVEERIAHIQNAIDNASESGNDETKSSAGDKHETGRAMMQLEQENNTAQFLEASKLKVIISKIKWDQDFKVVSSGCLVITNKGSFYVAISAGKIKIEENDYYAISPVSPIGSMLLGKSVGQEMEFNGQKYHIQEIH